MLFSSNILAYVGAEDQTSKDLTLFDTKTQAP